MSLPLRRLNPRFITRGQSFASLVALSTRVEYDYFWLVARIVALGNGSQTSDLTGTVTSVTDAVITVGEGSQTSDITGVLTSIATIEVGAGSQTVDGIILPTINADVEVGAGSQTSDITGDMVPFRIIAARGWLDNTTIEYRPGQSLWQANPRFQTGGISRTHALALVLPPSKTPGAFTNGTGAAGTTYGDIANDAQWTVVPFTAEYDGFGAHTIRDVNAQVVLPSSISDGAFGTHLVADAIRYVEPSGIASTVAFGTHAVYLYTRYLTLTSGIAAGSVGSHTVAFSGGAATQYIAQVGTTYTTYGTASLQSSIRQIFAQAILPKAVGSHAVENSTRYLTTAGWKDDEFGTPVLIGPQYIRPSGWNSFAKTNLTDVAYFHRTIYPASVLEHFFTEIPTISNYFPYIYPEGIPPPEMFGAIVGIPPFDIIDCTDYSINDSAVGDPEVSRVTRGGINLYNKGINAGAIGRPTLFPHNIIVSGIAAGAFGTTKIWNYIRYVYPKSLGVMVRFGTQWASFYIRNVYPVGFDSAVVWDPFGPIDEEGNAGRVHGGPVTIEPEGFDASGTTYDNCGFPRIPQVPRPSVT